jgi:hypothetical protein
MNLKNECFYKKIVTSWLDFDMLLPSSQIHQLQINFINGGSFHAIMSSIGFSLKSNGWIWINMYGKGPVCDHN